MAKREFLQLAHTYDPAKNFIAGWFVSEKLDGIRAFWDGGCSRGWPASEVPWANTAKDDRLTKEVIATGLWTRYGHVLRAPDGWLDRLPAVPLDGELYLGRQRFQDTISVTKSFSGADWHDVKYMVFDSPPLQTVLADGEINNVPNFIKKFRGCYEWIQNKPSHPIRATSDYITRNNYLSRILQGCHLNVQKHHQERLPFQTAKAKERFEELLAEICDAGGEGVMLKKPSGLYDCERSHNLLKYKPYKDAEATVLGYQWGKETDKGSKLLGLMGSMILKIEAGTFNLSGFTDAERIMTYLDGTSAFGFGCDHPGEEVPSNIHNPRFPRGSIITYKYREDTKDGLPKEARFWRRRTEAV
jgi:DNA ligase